MSYSPHFNKIDKGVLRSMYFVIKEAEKHGLKIVIEKDGKIVYISVREAIRMLKGKK